MTDLELKEELCKFFNFWILTRRALPPNDLLVEIKLLNGIIKQARIVETPYNENVWKTTDGKIAHLADYSSAEMQKFQIITIPNFKSPVAWRKIKESQK